MPDPIVLGDNEEIEIYGDRLTTPEKSRSRILIRNTVKVAPPPPVEPPPDPEPDPDPIPDAENRIINGKIEDAQGNGSLAGWEQDKGWYDTHIPLFECNKTHLIQGDRDYVAGKPKPENAWKGGNPSTATIWTLTRDGLPEHTKVNLSWWTAHHMFVGTATWELSGRNTTADPWTVLDTFDITEGVPGDKSCNQVGPKVILGVIGWRQYRLLASVTLASDKDGVVFGDIRLGLK